MGSPQLDARNMCPALRTALTLTIHLTAALAWLPQAHTFRQCWPGLGDDRSDRITAPRVKATSSNMEVFWP